ncbi:PREDICTED: serine/threonine-protein phosphatase 4 regulatory subunit 2-A-like [Fragaria vesca subsp. vesca]|uniref:serine/threonine-protein phosphatase 4 regulatory subunit 2-A-like n=1 Tax=Fragaria vesca subsp. vesca TaxID=101020 RepID=UPI0002C37367|nr:PREDICTED: serine/threonine-protein phosphatase 4 regulatory subunit 2-A-like [Fragaria vesca subsp. vesca]
MPSRPKKKPSKKKLKHSAAQLIIHHSLPTIQIHVPERFVETNSDVKFCCEEELSGCETASVTCQDHSCHPNLVAEEGQERSKFSADHHHQMADSSNGNGKLEESEKVQEGEVVESVRDIAIDDYSVEHAKKTHEEPAEAAEESPEVVESGDVVEEKEDEVVPVSIVEKETSVVEPEVKEEKEEEQYVPSVAETDGPSPVVEDDVSEEIEEKTKTDLVSNGVEESTLPSLSEVTTNVVSKGIEETEVPCSEEKEEEEVVTAAKGIEEVKLPVIEEISTGESSGADYKATSESVDDETLKPSPEVPVPPPVESTDAGEGYGKREIPETAEKPSIVSVTRAPLQPTSWRSCCGLFEVLHRSDR